MRSVPAGPSRVDHVGPTPTGGPGTEIVRRPVWPVQTWSPPRRPPAVGRTWYVAGNGDIEVVAGRRLGPVGPLAPHRVLTRRVVWFTRRRGCRPVAVLAAGAGRPSGGRWGHTVVAGLSAAVAIVGLGLLIATAEPSPTTAVAAGAADAPADELFVVPSAPAVDFVVPVLPADLPQLPAGPVDAGLTYPGLVPPVVPPPAAPVPVAPGPVAPLLPTTSTAGATTTARADGGAGSGGTGGTGGTGQTGGTEGTEGADTGSTPTPNPTPVPTCPAPAQPGPLVKALLPGPLQIETLVPAGPAIGRPFPDALPGVCLGLWTGGTGKPAVLVLGDRHAARETLLDADPPGGRSILVEHKDRSTRSYLLGDPLVSLSLDEAADLLTTTTAALVLVVSFNDDDTVTLVEATLVEAR